MTKTDLSKVRSLFDELGIGYEIHKINMDDLTYLELPTGNEKIGGYSNFSSEYVFDNEENFVQVNNWE